MTAKNYLARVDQLRPFRVSLCHTIRGCGDVGELVLFKKSNQVGLTLSSQSVPVRFYFSFYNVDLK